MKLRTLLLTAIAAAAMSISCFAQDITVTINGNIIDFPNQQPVVVEGRTLIPLRGVFDNIGYSIDWDGATKTVTLKNSEDTILINIGENGYYLNGEFQEIDVPAQIINGSTMLPLRAIGNAAGAEVLWDSNSKIATIVVKEDVNANMQGTTIVDNKQEENYVNTYSSIVEEFNGKALTFFNECNNISTNGIDSLEQLQKLSSLAKDANSAAVNAKAKIQALSTPAKYSELNKASIDYMQAVADMSQLYIDFIDGNISKEEFFDRLNTVGTDSMLKEAAYRDAFSAVFN